MKPVYTGRILNENYSDKLKKTLKNHIASCQTFDEMGHAIIPYISAWKIDTSDIWYEFVSRRFLEYFKTTPENLGKEFGRSVLDRRVYKHESADDSETVQPRQEIDDQRDRIRLESIRKGETQAVYKVQLPDNRIRWFKDWASVETYIQDGICLSPGYLADVSMEMDQKEQVGGLNIVVNSDEPQGGISEQVYHAIHKPVVSIGRVADKMAKEFSGADAQAYIKVITEEVSRLENVLNNLKAQS